MIKYFFYLLLASSSLFSFCNNDRDVKFNYKEFILKTDYRKFPPYIKFNLDRDLATRQIQVKDQMNFVVSSGFPYLEKVEEWSGKYNWEYADSLYKKFISSNIHHPSIDVFRQYGSFVILAKTTLLDEKGKNEKVVQTTKFYVTELMQTKYKGYGLLLYGIAKLNELNYDKKSIKTIAAEINEYSKKDASMTKKPNIKYSKELRLQVERNDSLNNEYRKKITSFLN